MVRASRRLMELRGGGHGIACVHAACTCMSTDRHAHVRQTLAMLGKGHVAAHHVYQTE